MADEPHGGRAGAFSIWSEGSHVGILAAIKSALGFGGGAGGARGGSHAPLL